MTLSIIADSREHRSGLIPELVRLGALVQVEELEAGDYVLAEGLAVERKEANDFVASILDRRLFAQVQLLKSAYARPFIIIEGNLASVRSAIEPGALAGALSYLAVLEGITVLHTANATQSALQLVTMARHATQGLGYEIAFRSAKPKDRQSQAQYLVEGLPGIGPAAAKKLLAHFGTPAKVLSASPAELAQVKGIGAKMAATVHEVLHFNC